MSNVVAFPGTKTDDATIGGPAKCIRCKYEWSAISPPGRVLDLECPHCGAFTGTFMGPIEPDGNRWACNCENQLFFLDAKGPPICANCGLRATGWADL